MGMDESTPDGATEARLAAHYGQPDLGDALLAALDATGTDTDGLARADIAAVDEFHVRGREATREVADLAGLGPDERVLDVGCGIGGPARTLAAEYDCDVVGIDVVEAYCNAARLLTDRVGLADTVRFGQANALELPFEDETFDAVWFEHTLMNIAATPEALAAARRVLRPGGTLALYTICAGPGGDPVFPVPWAAEPSLSYLARPADLRQLVTDAGFDEVAWRDVTEPSLAALRDVVRSMAARSSDAPELQGPTLLMGERSQLKVQNVFRNLEADRIAVVQGASERR